VLADPAKRGNRWDLEAFLATGRNEVTWLLRTLAESFPDVPRARALDFGCGVGRVTRALAGHFASVVGVDVAPSMIRKARELSAGVSGVEYVLNERDDLSFVPSGSVDLVYSVIVLQHIGQPYVGRYLAEFVRILSPQGLAIFQMPYASTLLGRLDEVYKSLRYGPQRMQMHVMPVEEVRAIVGRTGGQIVRCDESAAAGTPHASKLYFVRRDKP
jgi:ubiquinone/menaquinone biosynthesis C-methylase UbiE